MKKIQAIVSTAKGNKTEMLAIAVILAIALFFRTYKVVERFEFAHDGDLYSWIVKDIVVNKHARLIGQLTSAPGIFIGPLFYYLITPFFILFEMDPVGAIVPITIIGMLNVASYYFVFSKVFNKKVGLIAAFLEAVLISEVNFDRWVVPSTPTNLWLIWMFYTTFMLLKGNRKVYPILGLLIGTIWHIHIALAPILAAPVAAIILSKKHPNTKNVIETTMASALLSLPLIIFELKHGFLQTTSFVNNFLTNHGGGSGIEKFNLILVKIFPGVFDMFFYPLSFEWINKTAVVYIVLILSILLVAKKVVSKHIILMHFVWIFAVITFFSLSSSPISEYYFKSVHIVFISIASLLLYFLHERFAMGKYFVLLFLGLLILKSIIYYSTFNLYAKGYVERKEAIEYIAKDSINKKFPCVAISYISAPGENVGFRYFLWLNNIHTANIQSGLPIYTIVIPEDLVPEGSTRKFGHIGVIEPQQEIDKQRVEEECKKDNLNLLEPMLGFTN